MNTEKFFKDTPNILTLFNSFRNAYNQQRRTHVTHYHNASHANEVVVALISIGYTSPAVLLAAAYHDLVYIPMAGSDANERCSAALLGCMARTQNIGSPFSEIEKSIVNCAQVYIESTDIETHVQRDWEMDTYLPDEFNALLDADLSPLAADWNDFIQNQESIIRENGGTLSDSDYISSAKFLRTFVNDKRRHIYRTTAGREMWEEKAKRNIKEYCAMFDPVL